MKLTSLFYLLFFSFLFGCHKDPVLKDTSAKLEFSQDTVLFDTVFTTVGSSTKWLQVYNTHKKKLIVSSIRLAGGNNSFFKINVNGKSGREFKDVEIAGKDSIFIFVEVTVDPRNANSPMVVTDSLVFEINGNIQDVDLVAWGQDAYFHTPIGGTVFTPIKYCNEVWSNDKPHVVYGYAIVDSSCTLTITQGANIFIHNGSGILVYTGGSLKIKGTQASPVSIMGDRLQGSYRKKPGQWDRIWLYAGSINNEVEYAVIQNGNVGFQADTTGNSVNPTLRIKNTIIQNMAGAAIYAQGSSIEASNCVFANCGIHNVLLSIGGSYSFIHCTLANYWSEDTRKTPLLGLNNYYVANDKSTQVRNLTKAYFGNCILFGNLEKEIGLDYVSSGEFKYMFDYCLIRSDSILDAEMIANPGKFTGIIKYEKDTLPPLFSDNANNDYTLQSSSPAIDKGSTSIAAFVPNDLKGISRIALPDLGALEK